MQLLLCLFIVSTYNIANADSTAPISTHTQNPLTPNGNNNWYTSPVQFTVTSTDLESGVKEINYRINGGTWQKQTFSDSLNLAPNPSFEIPGATSTGMADWDATIIGGATYTRDTGTYLPGFAASAARIIASTGPWHAINNKNAFAVTTPFSNMSASVWAKTENVTGIAKFDVYSVSQDVFGFVTYILLGSSNTITGTAGWTNLTHNFVVNDANSIGVYIDIGLNSGGTLWADALTITESNTSAVANITINTDGSAQSVEYYAVDVANNAETYGCPADNCAYVSIDQTPPGNWYDSIGVRDVSGSDHELFVYTNVKDMTSGISTSSDQYMYTVDNETGFGHYSSLLHCNTAWKQDEWVLLETYPQTDGSTDVQLMTQKTDFCNSDWKVCKSARFYAEDVAGNIATKDFCINGPWIRFRGEGIVRSNQNVDMLAEADEDNTDGLIELGGNTVDFFTTSTNWMVINSMPPIDYSYDNYLSLVGSPTTLTDDLFTVDGAYLYDGDYEITNQKIPNNYDDATFDQVVFINGNLKISTGIEISPDSTALFIVNGDVEIDKQITVVGIAIFTDGNFYTAYNIGEGEGAKTLDLYGIYSANKFYFQRTLQGTNNEKYPSDSFVFEPKYIMQLRDFFGKQYIIWKSIE